MLKQHNQLIVSLLALADACAIGLAWTASYWIRFTWLPIDLNKGIPTFTSRFLTMLPLVIVAHLFIFSLAGLYRPRRDGSILSETRDIIKAFALAIVAVVMIDYALPQTNKISRQFIATYLVVGVTCFASFRATVRIMLRTLRRWGWNRRTAAIVGSGRTGQLLMHALRKNSWIGMEVLYFVDEQGGQQTFSVHGVPVHGPLSEVRRILDQQPVDSVFIALPSQRAHQTDDVLVALETCLADVRLVPEINPAFALCPNVSELEGVPILSLRQTPIAGWNAVLKRGFDLVVGGICLCLALLPMAVIAVLIKLTSPGPVFYRQRRMGLDGQEFTLIKFRTMRMDAEAETGPVWASADDPRRTRLGTFLRRTSLDELPNLFNVLAGPMSMVGPRPERPELIDQFKHEIPRYMLRHKMKAGLTGYAQIKGFRGNTSLKKRIQHDLHYMRHWSLGLDVRILTRTVMGAWFSKHEN